MTFSASDCEWIDALLFNDQSYHPEGACRYPGSGGVYTCDCCGAVGKSACLADEKLGANGRNICLATCVPFYLARQRVARELNRHPPQAGTTSPTFRGADSRDETRQLDGHRAAIESSRETAVGHVNGPPLPVWSFPQVVQREETWSARDTEPPWQQRPWSVAQPPPPPPRSTTPWGPATGGGFPVAVSAPAASFFPPSGLGTVADKNVPRHRNPTPALTQFSHW